MRVAIYARFSSDLQDVRSLADQVASSRGWRFDSRVARHFTPLPAIARLFHLMLAAGNWIMPVFGVWHRPHAHGSSLTSIA